MAHPRGYSSMKITNKAQITIPFPIRNRFGLRVAQGGGDFHGTIRT